MNVVIKKVCLLLFAVGLMSACAPQDSRPGFWLRGELQSQFPADWSFSNDHKEVFIEVATPYLLPHSLTIWCVEVDGNLFVAASRPEEKRWPGWVADEPDVKLQIGDELYPVTLEVMTNDTEIAPVRRAYAAKYELAAASGIGSGRYWRVKAR